MLIIVLVVSPAPRNGIIVVVLVLIDAYLIVILVLVAVILAMMYIVGVIGLQLLAAFAELEMGNNAQVLLNYLKDIHHYNKNIYKSNQHSFQCIHYSYSNWHNLDNILYTYSSWCDNLGKSQKNQVRSLYYLYKLYKMCSYHNNNYLYMNLHRLYYNFGNFGNHDKAHS